MRVYKKWDVVSVSWEKINDLKYVPNFPEKITSATGTITSVWRLINTPDAYVTVRLDDAPHVPNLQFHVEDITLVIPAEVSLRLQAIEEALALLTKKE